MRRASIWRRTRARTRWHRLYATRIDGLPRRQLDAASRLVAAQRFQWFIAAALVLLGLEMALRERTVAGA